MNKDTLITILSDMHSGGSTALFPNKQWWFDTERNHTPSARQVEMFKHFEKCALYAKVNSNGKRHILIHNGDAIEGAHHNTIQIVTPDSDEQSKIHIDLMHFFMKKSRFDGRKGDKLYYVKGTETHTLNKEKKIAEKLGAKKGDGGFVFDHLELQVNGRLLWLIHHGKKRGNGANEGNAMRNWLRDIFWDCLKIGVQPPDVLISGHTHTPTYTSYIARKAESFHVVHGIVCPSWQAKTRFAYKVAPVERNEIGAVFLEIKADGEIRIPNILVMETKSNSLVTV